MPAILRAKSRETKPYRPKAFGDYERGWVVKRIEDGAMIGNKEHYAVYVEWGRSPGKGPPLDALKKWVAVKNFRLKKVGPDQWQVRRQRGRGRGPRKMHWTKQVEKTAWALFWKIKEKGTPGKYVVARAVPQIKKVAGVAALLEMRKVRP